MKKRFTLKENAQVDEDFPEGQFEKRHLSKMSGNWKTEKMDHFCSQISSWKIESLRISGNNQSQILKNISHIKMPYLKGLYISNNNLQTIEGVETVFLPVLEELSLTGNCLQRVKILRKFNFPNMLYLWIDENHVLDSQILSEMKGKEFKVVNVEYGSTAKRQREDLSWVVKLQAKKLQTLRANNEKRIKQKQLGDKFKEKYGIDLY